MKSITIDVEGLTQPDIESLYKEAERLRSISSPPDAEALRLKRIGAWNAMKARRPVIDAIMRDDSREGLYGDDDR